MRHNHVGPFSVTVVSRFCTANPMAVTIDGGLRHARQCAKRATETGEKNAAFAVVKDVTGQPVFECRNIHGKAVQVVGK